MFNDVNEDIIKDKIDQLQFFNSEKFQFRMIYLNTDKTRMVKEYALEDSEELYIYLAYIFKIDIEVAYHMKCL